LATWNCFLYYVLIAYTFFPFSFFLCTLFFFLCVSCLKAGSLYSILEFEGKREGVNCFVRGFRGRGGVEADELLALLDTILSTSVYIYI